MLLRHEKFALVPFLVDLVPFLFRSVPKQAQKMLFICLLLLYIYFYWYCGTGGTDIYTPYRVKNRITVLANDYTVIR